MAKYDGDIIERDVCVLEAFEKNADLTIVDIHHITHMDFPDILNSIRRLQAAGLLPCTDQRGKDGAQ